LSSQRFSLRTARGCHRSHRAGAPARHRSAPWSLLYLIIHLVQPLLLDVLALLALVLRRVNAQRPGPDQTSTSISYDFCSSVASRCAVLVVRASWSRGCPQTGTPQPSGVSYQLLATTVATVTSCIAGQMPAQIRLGLKGSSLMFTSVNSLSIYSAGLLVDLLAVFLACRFSRRSSRRSCHPTSRSIRPTALSGSLRSGRSASVDFSTTSWRSTSWRSASWPIGPAAFCCAQLAQARPIATRTSSGPSLPSASLCVTARNAVALHLVAHLGVLLEIFAHFVPSLSSLA